MRYRFELGDERGALNLVDERAVRRGLDSASRGTVIPLAQPIRAGAAPIAAMRTPPVHFMSRDGGDYAAGLPERPGFGFADDSILLACHGATHLDALAHVWQDGIMYGGFSSDEVTSRGAKRCGIDKAGPFVCRGLLVDAVPEGADGLTPGTPVPVDVLRAALDGCDPRPGDALLVRTGWPALWRADPSIGTDSWPGLDVDSVEWILEAGFALVGADTIGVEVSPSSDPSCASPLHIALIRDHGVYFLELLALDALAQALAAAGRRDFLLVVAPLPIHQAVGSPVAPVAVL
ncbi:cyclase family protein [Streptosporangium sp. G11]|uniref:cyclase family protein n=1 Tax=Streptosporangium sp. G11 TaxID=3436926 RepID=UPI003EBA10D6